MPDDQHSQQEPTTIFKWETLHEVEPETLRWETAHVPGRVCVVELTNGDTIRVWRSTDNQQYFCHGLTFGGTEAPGGAISPYGVEVPTILRGYCLPVAEAQAKAGDILVWRGLDANDVVHSAILTHPAVVGDQNYLDYSTQLQSKNGIRPQATVTLEALILDYGESYNTYRRK